MKKKTEKSTKKAAKKTNKKVEENKPFDESVPILERDWIYFYNVVNSVIEMDSSGLDVLAFGFSRLAQFGHIPETITDKLALKLIEIDKMGKGKAFPLGKAKIVNESPLWTIFIHPPEPQFFQMFVEALKRASEWTTPQEVAQSLTGIFYSLGTHETHFNHETVVNIASRLHICTGLEFHPLSAKLWLGFMEEFEDVEDLKKIPQDEIQKRYEHFVEENYSNYV